MFAATALPQPPETTAADDNAVAPAHLGTRDDDDLARLRAGEATSLVLLTATALGLASRPITEPLEIPETRKAVRAGIFELNEFPQMLLRVGWAPLNADPLPSTPRWPLADVGDAVGRLGVRVTESIRRRQRRNRNTSSRGRRGVAGASFVVGAIPTRISTWDTASCPITAATSSRVLRSSVMWVTVQVPKPAIVHSSRTADSTSPHINASFRESP